MGLVSLLHDRRFIGYLRFRIPHEYDAIVERVVAEYRAGSSTAKQEVVDEVSYRVAAVLSAYGERMAAVAIRTGSPEPLRRGLISMAMADGRLEAHVTNLSMLAAVNHSAGLLGTTLAALIDDVAAEIPESTADAFRAFIQRSERDKSLKSFFLDTAGEGDEFRYITRSSY
jgi:hypothetical protein